MNPSPTLLNCLRTNGLGYEIIPHAQAFTARMAAAAEGIDRHQQAKVVIAKAQGQPVMAVLPADRQLNLRKLEQITHGPVTLAQEGEFAGLFPDCAVGAMPPFGNLYGLPTYVDRRLAEQDDIVFEAGTYTDAIRLRYRDYEQVVKPQVADLALD